jgi:hypothetical protein
VNVFRVFLKESGTKKSGTKPGTRIRTALYQVLYLRKHPIKKFSAFEVQIEVQRSIYSRSSFVLSFFLFRLFIIILLIVNHDARGGNKIF